MLESKLIYVLVLVHTLSLCGMFLFQVLSSTGLCQSQRSSLNALHVIKEKKHTLADFFCKKHTLADF